MSSTAGREAVAAAAMARYAALIGQPISCCVQLILAAPLSIDDPSVQVADERAQSDFAAAEARADLDRVRAALSTREWSVLSDYYLKDLSQAAISATHGLTPMGISKIRRRAIAKARRILTGFPPQ